MLTFQKFEEANTLLLSKTPKQTAALKIHPIHVVHQVVNIMVYRPQSHVYLHFTGISCLGQTNCKCQLGMLLYTLSHPENDRDVSAYSSQRRLSSPAQLVCFLTRSKRNTGIDA